MTACVENVAPVTAVPPAAQGESASPAAAPNNMSAPDEKPIEALPETAPSAKATVPAEKRSSFSKSWLALG